MSATDTLDLNITEVTEIPKSTREGRGTKYDVVFEAAADSETGVIMLAFEDVKSAAARATYLRRLTNEDSFVISQRGTEVYVATAEAAASAE